MAKKEPEPKDATADQATGYPVPADFKGKPGADLLMQACELFGVNPDPTLPLFEPTRHRRWKGRGPRPDAFRELASWKFYPAAPGDPEPDKVVIVTAGGVKLGLFDDPDPDLRFDEATERSLREWFKAYRIDPKTKERIEVPLPDDLTLPRAAVTGFPPTEDHVYRKGYLREGGRAEGDRRAARQQPPAPTDD